jgi:hypothetical protein
VVVNTAEPVFDADDQCVSPKVSETVQQMAGQVLQFAMLLRGACPLEAEVDVA